MHSALQKIVSGFDIAFVAHASDPGIPTQKHHAPDVLIRKHKTLAHNMGIAATRLLPQVGSVLFFDNRTIFKQIFFKILLDTDLYWRIVF